MSNEIQQSVEEALKSGLTAIKNEENQELLILLSSQIEILRQALAYQKAIQSNMKRYNKWSKLMIEEGVFKGFRANTTQQVKLNVYNACNTIIDILLSRELSTSYVFYYTDTKGVVHRVASEHVNSQSVSVHKSSRLRILRGQISQMEKAEEVEQQMLNKHYTSYRSIVARTYKGIIGQGQINEGHIAEAFERHYQKVHINEDPFNSDESLNVNTVWEEVRESLGNAGWWTGGDVGNIQVKSLFGKTGDVRLTYVKTIEEVGNFLLWIYDHKDEDLINNKEFFDYAVQFFTQSSKSVNIDSLFEVDAYDMVEQSLT